MSQAIRGLGAEGDCCRGVMVRQALSEVASRVCVHILTTQAHTETQQVLRHTDTYSHTQPRPRYSPEPHSGRHRISYPHRLTYRDTQSSFPQSGGCARGGGLGEMNQKLCSQKLWPVPASLLWCPIPPTPPRGWCSSFSLSTSSHPGTGILKPWPVWVEGLRAGSQQAGGWWGWGCCQPSSQKNLYPP